MLCAKCQEREATVHICKIAGNETSSTDLCHECARAGEGESGGIELAPFVEMLKWGAYEPETFWRNLLGRDERYPIEAYEFVGDAFEDWTRRFNETREQPRAAAEVLAMIAEFAVSRFGRRAKAALAEWKIFGAEDLGQIVIKLGQAGLFPMFFPPQDYLGSGFDFDEAFPES